MSCTRAQEFLADAEIKSETNASKEPFEPAKALALARQATKVVTARGKKLVTLDVTATTPDDETLLAHLLGPSGKLRAPTLRKGKTLLVGFNADAYRQILKKE